MALQYLVDEAFSGDDEFGFAWNDPGAAIPWPGADPVILERDASSPSMSAVVGVAPPTPIDRGSGRGLSPRLR